MAELNKDNDLKCPKCQSKNLIIDKKGFSGKKAAAGAVVTGGIGLLAGTIGSNDMMINCINCGLKYDASEHRKLTLDYQKEREFNRKKANGEIEPSFGSVIVAFIFALIPLIFAYNFFMNDWTILGWVCSIATLFMFLMVYVVYDDYSETMKRYEKRQEQLKKEKNNEELRD